MSPALKRALGEFLVELGRWLVRFGELVCADVTAEDAATLQQARRDFTPWDSAAAHRELRSLGDLTPEETEILNRLRPRKRGRGDDT